MQFCRKVWLGLYDSQRDQAEPDSRDEQKIKDFMAQKYERKRWYQAPTDSMKEEARQINESATNRQPPTRQLKTLLGEKTPQLVVQNQVILGNKTLQLVVLELGNSREQNTTAWGSENSSKQTPQLVVQELGNSRKQNSTACGLEFR